MKRKRSARRNLKVGLPPGTPVYTGDVTDVPVRAAVIDYDAESLTESAAAPWEEVRQHRDTDTTSWVDIVGLHDVEALRKVSKHFGVHPLVLEDLLSVESRPKIEAFDDQLAVVVRTAVVEDESVRLEHVGLVLGKTWVLSMQERPGDVFEAVRNRLRTASGRIRRMGADYLLHALLDAIIDGYFSAIETLEDRLDRLEVVAMQGVDRELPQRLHELRMELGSFRRTLLPLRTDLASLGREDGPIVTEEVRPYFRDLTDHCAQVLDLVEASRDRASGLLELHLASTNNRMSEVMGVLTVVSTTFIPLTFLAGIYGMNFEYMPELKFPYAYPTLLVVMAVTGVTVYTWIRNRLM